jgi:hypothetical protein
MPAPHGVSATARGFGQVEEATAHDLEPAYAVRPVAPVHALVGGIAG